MFSLKDGTQKGNNMDDGLSRGVIIFNVGTKCLVRLIVCLRSLRKHYSGNLTVFLDGAHDPSLVKSIVKNFNANVVRTNFPDEDRALLRKMESCLESPYDLTIFLDSDTIILGDISELFEMAKGKDLVVTHFAGWKSDGRTITKRINRFASYKPEYIEQAKNFGPALNTGVFAWQKNSKIFKEWLDLTKWGFQNKVFIADEIACQLLAPRYNCYVADKKYNVSVLHDHDTEQPVIIHFHGKKHCIEAEKSKFWLQEFIEAVKDNVCDIKNLVLNDCDDRRLKRFIAGNNKTIHADLQAQIKNILGCTTQPACEGFKDSEVTIVTAFDKKYIDQLRETLPNWIKHKHVDQFEFIVYVNGFRRAHRNKELDFLKVLPHVRIIPWDMPEIESQREKMLTAYVIGAARDVKTPYWVKIDTDAFATDDSPLITPEMKDYVICGHKWGYSFAKHISPLIDWANNNPAFENTPKDVFDLSKVDGKRYSHQRVASFVQFHKSDFVRLAAKAAGDRLPIPSHDTYLWYVANRLGLPIMRCNFKRKRGMNNKSGLEALRGIVQNIDSHFLDIGKKIEDVDIEND